MRKTFKTLALVAVAAMTLIGCQKESAPQTRNAEGLYKYTFNVVDGEAKIDADTKATIGDGNIEWVSGDQVGVFIGSTPNYAKMDITTTPVKAVLYSSSAIEAGTKVYGYYPYLSSNETASSATIHFASVQQGAESSAMPLAGVPFDVEDEIDPKAQSGNGELKFLNLGSLVVFKIWSANADEQAETIQYVELEGNEATLAGDAVLDLTAVDPSNAESLAVTFVENDEPSVKVNQTAAVASSKDGATPVKMVIAPGTFSSTLKICTDAHTYYFELASKTYNRSGMRTFGVNLANAISKEGVDLDAVKLPYEESFATDAGEFSIMDISNPDNFTIWTHSNQSGSYMKATGYESNTIRHASESMLVSPWINLVDISAATVSFDHAVNYTNNISDKSAYLSLWIMTDEQNAAWQKVTIPNYGAGNNFTFVASGAIDITSFCGNNVKIAFKYISGGTNDDTPTWEIKNFIVDVKKVDCDLTYGEKDHFELVLGSEDYNEWTAPEIGNPHSLLDITYASNNEDVAVVDEGTGAVTLQGAPGTAVITASFAGDAQYNPGSASYTIKVIDPTATTVTDVLNRALTGVSGSSYADWSGKTSNSDAVYAGNSAGGNESIQLRSKNNSSGIVTTASGGYATKVTVVWNSNTAAGRTLNVYGKNTAYTNVTDLYGDNAGTLLGTIVCGTSTELIIYGNYEFIGLRSAADAMYLTQISIEWSTEAGETPTFDITIADNIPNGFVSANKTTEIEAGEDITLTISPATGYVLETLTVDNTNVTALVSNNTYSFTMPAHDVAVSATFKAAPSGYSASITIGDYATDNNWVTSTQYTTIAVNDIITASAAGGGNTGKYYSTDNTWRFYANENATLTLSAATGYTIKAASLTFTVKDNGTVLNGETNVTSGASISVNASSVEFTISQSTGNKGKVFITGIEVTYE